MEIPLLVEIVIILGLSIPVSFICSKLKIPPIVGFLITGVLAGPAGLSLVSAMHEVEVMAEIGVILLLFSIGLEFSFKHLFELRRTVLVGGSIQVGLTILLTAVIAQLFDFSWEKSIFFGFLVALSSTAIVLNQLQASSAIDAPHGRTSLSILIFQDIVIVPMMILTPLLSGNSQINTSYIALLLGKATLLVVFVFVGTRWLIPKIFFQIAKTQLRELFLLSIVFLAFAIAWLTSMIGLSLALGAFLAGLMISESEYSHNAISHILPFRDIFLSFFFVSVGMLLDIRTILNHYEIIIFVLLALVLLKLFTSGAAALILGYPLRTAVFVALALAQIGEFSFVLAKEGYSQALISGEFYQIFLSVTILTMIFTPFLIRIGEYSDRIANFLPLPAGLKNRKFSEYNATKTLEKHLIIAGYGLSGRNLAHTARSAQIPYLILEMNPETVRKERFKGEPIYFGDACQRSVLKQAGIHLARVMVVAVSDAAAVRRIVFLAKLENPELYIIVRTRFVREIEPLRELGADEIVAEEFESSIEIFTRVLKRFLISDELIDALNSEVRADGYNQLRKPDWSVHALDDLKLPDVRVSRMTVNQVSGFADKTLSEIGLRKKYGVTLLAIIRAKNVISNPSSEERISAGDQLIVLGHPDQISVLMTKI
ncbi:MAG: cation:proton antiporter [Calditrichaceae bacterium]